MKAEFAVGASGEPYFTNRHKYDLTDGNKGQPVLTSSFPGMSVGQQRGARGKEEAKRREVQVTASLVWMVKPHRYSLSLDCRALASQLLSCPS